MVVILIAVVYFMAGMILYQFLKPDISIARISVACTAPVTYGDKGICLILDGVIPLFIIAVVSATGGIITNKFLG